MAEHSVKCETCSKNFISLHDLERHEAGLCGILSFRLPSEVAYFSSGRQHFCAALVDGLVLDAVQYVEEKKHNFHSEGEGEDELDLILSGAV